MFACFFTINAALNQVLYQSPDALKIVDFLWISLVQSPYLNYLHNGVKGNKTVSENSICTLPEALLVPF
jgi:hypothetical protein